MQLASVGLKFIVRLYAMKTTILKAKNIVRKSFFITKIPNFDRLFHYVFIIDGSVRRILLHTNKGWHFDNKIFNSDKTYGLSQNDLASSQLSSPLNYQLSVYMNFERFYKNFFHEIQPIYYML